MIKPFSLYLIRQCELIEDRCFVLRDLRDFDLVQRRPKAGCTMLSYCGFKEHILSVFSEVLGSNLLNSPQDEAPCLHLGIMLTCSIGICKSKLITHLVGVCTAL